MIQRTIWGFEVETSPKGKNVWPYELKREVVKRILDDDHHIGTMVASGRLIPRGQMQRLLYNPL